MIRKPIETFQENLEEVKNLLAIHSFTTGKKPGRRHSGFSTLNKSGVVLLVACWEAFIEDLAEKTFDALLRSAQSPSYFPKEVRKLIVAFLKKNPNELKVLELAGNGWKNEFKNYKSQITERLVDGLNTPSAVNIDKLFSELIGLNNLSKCWSWHKSSPGNARKRLAKLIKLRGDIAHRVKSKSDKTVRKDIVEKYLDFIQRLAIHSNNRINSYLKGLKKSAS